MFSIRCTNFLNFFLISPYVSRAKGNYTYIKFSPTLFFFTFFQTKSIDFSPQKNELLYK